MRLFGFFERARPFLRDCRANVAMTFVLAMIPLMTATGAAVDYSRAVMVRTRLVEALDAAGLAAGAATNLNETQMKSLAQSYFNANYDSDDLGSPGTITLVMNGNVLTLSASATLDTAILRIVGIDTLTVNESIDVTRGSLNVEVGLALDTTGSMDTDDKIGDLRDAAKELIDIVVQSSQTPYYSKVALIPYSMAVNVGSYANSVRGPLTAGKTISATNWYSSSKNITGISKANPGVVTSNGHGFANGDFVYISGVNGMTQVNSKIYKVASVATNTFRLQTVAGVNVNTSSGYSTYTNSGTARKCYNSECNVQITSNSHGYANAAEVYVTGVNNMTGLNDELFTVESKATNTFILADTYGPDYGTTAGSTGTADCVLEGCNYFKFTNASSSTKIFKATTCVTERSTNEKTDVAPSTTYMGRNYRDPSSPCLNSQIVPLSSDKTYLKAQIDDIDAEGSTGGHIGVGWAWYMISPNFKYLWPSASQPAEYNTIDTIKVVVLMTDGLFNSPYCKGVIAKDATSGSGSSSDHINCDAPNGDAYEQAEDQCDAMKAKGVIVYTVGFDIGSDDNAEGLMDYCASSEEHEYLADSGEELSEAFKAIGRDISSLRVSR